MGKWADRAKLIEDQHPRANSANSADSPPIDPNDANDTLPLASRPAPAVPIGISADAPPAWKAHVAALRRSTPLVGLSPVRWREYCADARWLIDCHGAELAAAGFVLADLFELMAGRRDGGGLVEQLRGARDITIDGLTVHFTRGRVQVEFIGAGGGDVTGWIGRASWQP